MAALYSIIAPLPQKNMDTNYRQTRYLISARNPAGMPADVGGEAAFAGRSNSGKSSAINAICGQKGLARVSQTPGRTQMINFFALTGHRRLVDLPGYGYAKAPAAVQAQWHALVEDYVTHRASLRGLLLTMDIRRPLTDYDLQLLDWRVYRRLPMHILLTKADKLSRGAALNTAQAVAKAVGGASVQVFSAPKHQGVEEVRAVLNEWLDL